MKKYLRKLFCKHQLEYIDQHKEQGGMIKVIEYKCKKCGKEIWKIYENIF